MCRLKFLKCFLAGAFALRAPPLVGHTKRSQGLFNLDFPKRTRSTYRRWPPTTASNTRLGGASSSIRMTWLSQRNRWLLIRFATSMLSVHWRAHTATSWFGYGSHRQLLLDQKSCAAKEYKLLDNIEIIAASRDLGPHTSHDPTRRLAVIYRLSHLRRLPFDSNKRSADISHRVSMSSAYARSRTLL